MINIIVTIQTINSDFIISFKYLNTTLDFSLNLSTLLYFLVTRLSLLSIMLIILVLLIEASSSETIIFISSTSIPLSDDYDSLGC